MSKFLLSVIVMIGLLLWLDHLYLNVLEVMERANIEVMERWCHPNIVTKEGTRAYEEQ